MGLIKDWQDNHEGYVFTAKIKELFNPAVWIRLQKYRTQRADRGWSDRDMWGMGEYVAQITAEMLNELKDGHTDWEWWFKMNGEQGKGAYKNLEEVVNDINGYLDFSKTNWAEGLTSVNGKTGKFSISWVNEKGKKITEAEITNRINKHQKEETKRYKKAAKAMSFFGRHFWGFWD